MTVGSHEFFTHGRPKLKRQRRTYIQLVLKCEMRAVQCMLSFCGCRDMTECCDVGLGCVRVLAGLTVTGFAVFIFVYFTALLCGVHDGTAIWLAVGCVLGTLNAVVLCVIVCVVCCAKTPASSVPDGQYYGSMDGDLEAGVAMHEKFEPVKPAFTLQ